MTPVLVTPPIAPVVSLASLKSHLRIIGTDEDEDVAAIEQAAVAHLDGWRGVLGRCLMAQTWLQDFAAWGRLRIVMPDASGVVVTYKDADGLFQTATEATTGIDGLGPYVDAEGPTATVIRVQYTCELPAEQLPAAQMAVKLYAEHLHDGSDLSPAFGALVSAMRWRGV